MTDIRNSINDLLLEKYVLGELPQAEARKIEDRLAAEPGLAERVVALKKSDDEILARYPARIIVERIQARNEATEEKAPRPGTWRDNRMVRTAVYSFGCALALACLFIVFFPTLFPNTYVPSTEESILVKGDVGLKLYRQTDSGFEQLKNNALVHRGDRFQLKYNAGNASYGVIFSVDGNGNVTLHFPQGARTAPALKAKGDTALFDAFELDDAPGFERFFFVVSTTEFAVSDMLEKGSELAENRKNVLTNPLDIGPQYKQVSFTLIKEGSR